MVIEISVFGFQNEECDPWAYNTGNLIFSV